MKYKTVNAFVCCLQILKIFEQLLWNITQYETNWETFLSLHWCFYLNTTHNCFSNIWMKKKTFKYTVAQLMSMWSLRAGPLSVTLPIVADNPLQVGPVCRSSVPSVCFVYVITVRVRIQTSLICGRWRFLWLLPCRDSSALRTTWKTH